MCRGKVQQEGTPEEVQNHPNSPFTLYFTDVDVNRLPSACQASQILRLGLVSVTIAPLACEMAAGVQVMCVAFSLLMGMGISGLCLIVLQHPPTQPRV